MAIPKTIGELKESFHIAPYQRGYKWRPEEVERLLDDINSFVPRDGDDFYCLQPITVACRDDGSYELIDGQQRMTTIYMVLKYLGESSFKIDYKTRTSSEYFLDEIESVLCFKKWADYVEKLPENDNIDNYHFFKAYHAIKEWFDGTGCTRAQFKPKLLDQTQIIWYVVKSESGYEKTFLNLNSGRIPLTESELIKAFFLKSPVVGSEELRIKQTEIAQEWDRIETELHIETFWGFLRNSSQPEKSVTRIHLIFDLITHAEGNEVNFEYYQNKAIFNHSEEWNKVKACFLRLMDWLEDRDLYHKIGYLIEIGGDNTLKMIYKESQGKGKKAFSEYLEDRIKNIFKGVNLEELQYKSDDRRIHQILLWFNICSLAPEVRFPFNVYKNTKWSLEHIHAQNSRRPSTVEGWKDWGKGIQSAANKALDDELERLSKSDDAKIEEWENLEREIVKYYGPDLNDYDKHSIENLALLCRDNNSALSNHLFPQKRLKIIELDKEGAFIPVCTKNVFMKYYSHDVTSLNIWTRNDREDYLNEIKNKLEYYLHSEMEGLPA